jgi:hypothetical protein
MKKKLLLYLSKLNMPDNPLTAATLAWAAEESGYIFDNYYDSYHQGIHFPGGDVRNLDTGQLTGGTVCGDGHFGEFCFLLQNFDVSIVSTGGSIFLQSAINLGVPVVSCSDNIAIFYKEVFAALDISRARDIVMVGSGYGKHLSGITSYFYPEIYYRRAIGLAETISNEDLADITGDPGNIFCVFVEEERVRELMDRGYNVEVVDRLKRDDDYFSITKRIAMRWKDRLRGWVLGDPVLVTHWLPTACEEDRLALYGIPQEKVVSRLSELISSKRDVVYGRQYSDRDFFALSALNQCLQVIDPCRPPFQSVRHAEYSWDHGETQNGFYEDEYSDEELRQFAGEGRVLISLMFWSGMIREVANFQNLIDLIAMTGLRCGLVVTAQSYEYMMHPPFELITKPSDRGGVYPYVEPVLGSCGTGVGIESLMSGDRLGADIGEALSRIKMKVKSSDLMPRGWWATMDADLIKLNSRERPKPVRFLRYPPYFQVRFHSEVRRYDEDSAIVMDEAGGNVKKTIVKKLKQLIIGAGLMKYFEPYRPYEFYKPGPIKEEVVGAVKSSGLKYMFTKSGFNSDPGIKYIDEDFIALNYTAGQWDGWTPFETVNDVSDLKKSEKKLLRSSRPGWIVSTIDSCLWTFSGEFWKRGSRLFEIARYCAAGGKSGKLVNVKPCTVARYARIVAGYTK